MTIGLVLNNMVWIPELALVWWDAYCDCGQSSEVGECWVSRLRECKALRTNLSAQVGSTTEYVRSHLVEEGGRVFRNKTGHQPGLPEVTSHPVW